MRKDLIIILEYFLLLKKILNRYKPDIKLKSLANKFAQSIRAKVLSIYIYIYNELLFSNSFIRT